MAEVVEPGALQTPKKRRKLQVSDIVIFAVLLIIIVALAWTLVSKLTLKHNVAAARVVADKAIVDLGKRDGAAARSLGSDKFKSTYSADTLTKQFKAVEVATTGKPTMDTQTLFTGSSGKTAYFIYKYSRLKVPYYVRVAISKKTSGWQLTNISGNADESTLMTINN